MQLRQLWLALGLVAAYAAGAAVIYKWTDADGVVHYSDQEVPGAERIVTYSNSSNGIGGTTRSPHNAPVKPAATHLQLSEFAIVSPAKEQVFFADEPVPVRLGLEPSLKPNQAITWNLNGSPLADQSAASLSFVLQTQPRGTYVITATIRDTESGESQSTDSVTFYVRQPSELDPLRRR